MKENYQKILDQNLKEIEGRKNPPSLLLHSCCAPCSSYVLDYLSQYFKITVFYYNPNIYPDREYEFREKEQEKFIEAFLKDHPEAHPITFMKAPYEKELYYKEVRGHEKDPEKGARCFLCYEMRLKKTAETAKKGGFDYFTTTLSISPHKDAQKLNAIGKKLAEEYQVSYLFSDFKKKEGFKKSLLLSEKYQIYRQNYCGCLFSYQANQERKIPSEESISSLPKDLL